MLPDVYGKRFDYLRTFEIWARNCFIIWI